jgi:hypothetical protein
METASGHAVDTIDIPMLYLLLLCEESSWGMPECRRQAHPSRRREQRIPAMPTTSCLADTPGVLAVSH